MLDQILIPKIDNEYPQLSTNSDAIFVKVCNLTNELHEILNFANIRRLEFWDVVVSYNLLRFLGECNFVQELNFANVTLDSRRRIKCPEGLSLLNVKVMKFFLKWNVELTVHELILFEFLSQVKFGKLEHVKICSSRSFVIDGHFEKCLATTDPLPKIQFPSGVKSTEVLAFLIKNHQSIKKLTVTGFDLGPFGTPIEELTHQLDLLQYEEMECHIRTAVTFNGNESLVLEGQRTLKKLDIRIFFGCWPTLARAIQASVGSLVEVKVNTFFVTEFDEYVGGAEEYVTQGLDASIFKDCAQLECLCLNIYTPILNLSSFPDSIRSLSLDRRAVSTQEDFLAIASKLCNLKTFNLTLSDSVYDSTVNVEIVQAFTGIETLELLRIENCRTDEDPISNFAKSQHEFEINFELYGGQTANEDHYGILTISKKLTTPSEPPASHSVVNLNLSHISN